MQKTQILSNIDKATLYKLKPRLKNVKNMFDQINTKKNTKQQLRDIILDYIIQKLFKQNHKQKSRSSYKTSIHGPNLKKIPIEIQAQVNGVKRTISANGYYVLQRYIEFQKKNMYRQNNIQPLVVQILNFFDQMQEIAGNINFEIPQHNNDLPHMIINILLEKYNKNRQRINRIKQLNMFKSKTIAKYTSVSYLDIENNLQKKECQIYVQKSHDSSHRISRDTINSTITEKESTQINDIKNSRSKLKDLVDNYKVFQHPQKIQKLRIQRLKQIYGATQIEKASEKVKKQPGTAEKKSRDPSQGYIKFLQYWIGDISISQKLYKQKMERKQTKRKQSEVHVAKIIEESEDQELDESKFRVGERLQAK